MLYEQIKHIESKEQLADFIAALVQDLLNNRTEWENVTLDSFLEAMESWVRSMDNYYKNTGQAIPVTPSWKTFADMLYAGKIYE